MSELSILGYSDYRSFLRDYYVRQKQKNASYSFRAFALRAGLSSPNYLKLVIDGQRRITDRNLPNFIRGLRLSRWEAEYFRNLVFFQEAGDAEAKAMHQRELVRIRNRHTRAAKRLESDRLEILKSWVPWVVREMVLLDNFRPDPAWIASKLRPRVEPDEAAAALELLERLEFIRLEGGKYRQCDPLITTADEMSLLLIRNLHRQFMEFAQASVLEDTKDERETSGLTIAIPRHRLSEMKSVIQEFRKELNKRFSSDAGNDSVFHLEVAFFPMTQKEPGK